MKLYTRGQVARRILYGMLAAIILSAGLFYNLGKNSTKTGSDKQPQVTEISQEVSQELTTAASDVLTDIIPVAGSTATYSQDENENINVYRSCNEAVVNIYTKVTSYDWFWDPYVTDGGSGSGSIIDKKGYILTNVHAHW